MKTWSDIRDDETFWSRFRVPDRDVLMLDYDGTLAPFRVEPGKAVPYPGVKERLDLLLERGCRVVFVTGRIAQDLAGLLDLRGPVEIWGSHGAERLHRDGRFEPVRLTAGQAQGLEAAARLAGDKGVGDRVETKPGCRAAHWRGLPPDRADRARDVFREVWGGVAAEYGLALHDFDGGMELRVPGLDKGRAVRIVLREAGAGAQVAFLGDDLTDEDGFGELRGHGAAVLVRSEPRPSLADIWLRPPEELLAFLDAWSRLCA
jgi:trehalose-phosphatase